jgi:hypothetical protein
MTRFPLPLLLSGLTLFILLGLNSPPAGSRDPGGWRASLGGQSCAPWQQVNDPAFGLPSSAAPDDPEPYASEEGFEVLVYADQLYLGMEADNSLGARLWRTRRGVTAPASQADWEEVIADENGLPWGVGHLPQVDHIDSLAGFGGYLYASSANSGAPTGTLIFRSPTGDPGSWEPANAAGFGDPANENFKDMQVFDGWLCGGTWNAAAGGAVWCTQDGLAWQQKSPAGFGDPRNVIIWFGEVFDGGLYFATQNFGDDPDSLADDTARIYRTRSLAGAPEWEAVYEGGGVSLFGEILGEFEGALYVAASSRYGIEIYRSPTGDAGSWELVNTPGMSGNRFNLGGVTDGAAVYQGALFVAVNNRVSGMRVWRWDGAGLWQPVGSPRAYDPAAFAAQLAVFEGRLYAWTSNYARGQAALATMCTAEPARPPAGMQTLLTLALLLALAAALWGGAFRRGAASPAGGDPPR